MLLLLQVAVILAVSATARTAVRHVGQPAVVGEVTAGLLLGPSFFGWLLPTTFARLFPADGLVGLEVLSQIGLILFMFMVGLELRSTPVKIRRAAIVSVSTAGIVAPFALGAGFGALVHARLAPSDVDALPFALFIGTALSFTAFPVLARILAERRLVATELGTLAMTCAAANDVVGWLLLGGVLAFVGGGGAGAVLLRSALFVVYLGAMLGLVAPGLRKLPTRTAGGLAVPVLLILVSALATEWLGVHALFGAFFAGFVMPVGAGPRREVLDRIEPLTAALLLPLFFALTGLRTNIPMIDGGRLWIDVALALGAAIVGKVGGTALAARATGSPWRDAAALGVLVNTRGLIELVVLSVGLEIGILSPVVFSMLVIVALVTTFMTSPILSLLIPAPIADRAERQRIIT